jgi:hypothetical protein
MHRDEKQGRKVGKYFPLAFGKRNILLGIVRALATIFGRHAQQQQRFFLNILKMALTVPISLAQHLLLYGKSYFWPKFFIQPPGTQ